MRPSGKVVALRKKGYLSKVNLRCKKKIFTFVMAMMVVAISLGAKDMDSLLPVRGFAIETPSVRDVDLFVRFIEEDLAPARVNLLILRVDWNYAYQSHPELQDEHPLC